MFLLSVTICKWQSCLPLLASPSLSHSKTFILQRPLNRSLELAETVVSLPTSFLQWKKYSIELRAYNSIKLDDHDVRGFSFLWLCGSEFHLWCINLFFTCCAVKIADQSADSLEASTQMPFEEVPNFRKTRTLEIRSQEEIPKVRNDPWFLQGPGRGSPKPWFNSCSLHLMTSASYTDVSGLKKKKVIGRSDLSTELIILFLFLEKTNCFKEFPLGSRWRNKPWQIYFLFVKKIKYRVPVAWVELGRISLCEPWGVNWFLEDIINPRWSLNSRISTNTCLQKSHLQNSIRKWLLLHLPAGKL